MKTPEAVPAKLTWVSLVAPAVAFVVAAVLVRVVVSWFHVGRSQVAGFTLVALAALIGTGVGLFLLLRRRS